MGLKTICECDMCHNAIIAAKDGFIVQGNIYAADTNARLGIIGNNFPKTSEDGTIVAKDVKETFVCKGCMMKTLFPSTTNIRR